MVMMTLISWTAKQRLDLTFIHSWRVLSAPTGPIQALNPNWIFTKEENYRGRSTFPFSSQAWLINSFLHLATKPLLAEQKYCSSRILFWWMILSFEPWNGATSSSWSRRWWATPGRLHARRPVGQSSKVGHFISQYHVLFLLVALGSLVTQPTTYLLLGESAFFFDLKIYPCFRGDWFHDQTARLHHGLQGEEGGQLGKGWPRADGHHIVTTLIDAIILSSVVVEIRW